MPSPAGCHRPACSPSGYEESNGGDCVSLPKATSFFTPLPVVDRSAVGPGEWSSQGPNQRGTGALAGLVDHADCRPCCARRLFAINSKSHPKFFIGDELVDSTA